MRDYGGLLRIIANIRFKTLNGWTEARKAILDTGAHTSLIPLSLWKKVETKILADYFVKGLVPKEEQRQGLQQREAIEKCCPSAH